MEILIKSLKVFLNPISVVLRDGVTSTCFMGILLGYVDTQFYLLKCVGNHV